MKKNTIALIACTVALLAAGGGYAALMLTDGGDESSSASSEAVSMDESSVPVSLLDFEKSDIESVTVKNSSGEYTGIPDGEPAEDGTVTFTIKGFEKFDINTTLTSSLLNSSAALNSDSTAEENPADLEKYGLKSPLAEVRVKAGSGEKTILVGNESPVKGETYCMEKDGDSVYLAATSSLSVFLNDAEKYISTTLLEKPADDAMPTVEEIKIERPDLDYDIVLKYDDSTDDENTTSGTLATHYMTEPVFAYLDVEKSQDATQGLFGLSAQSVMIVSPSDDEIAASGLDKPLCTVTMKTDEPKEYTLKIGSKLEVGGSSCYLVMFNDNDIIYAVDSENLCWATLQPGDITSRMVFGTYVWDIGKLDISVDGGEKVSFEGSGTSQDDYKVTKNGKGCDSERFRSFYTFLLKTSAEEFVIDEEPSGDPVVSISLETQDGKTKQTIDFYKADGKKALISVNGTPCFKCRMAYVDLLIDNLSKFDTDEEFVMNW